MKKIIIIIILIISVGLIGTGVYFGLTGSKGKYGDNPDNGEIVNLDEEIAKDEDVHSENLLKFKTVNDATDYLIGIYETNQVTVTYNDGIIARIKVFEGTENEEVYIYQINGGDLVMDY